MKGVIAYVLSKKYTDDSLIGMGALKGANCKVKDVVKVDKTTTVTLSWKDDLDVDHDTDFEILDGLDGVDVVSATISNTYHLILTLSDGNTIDAGVISDKVTIMPTASSSNVGMINQFIGTTDSNYTHGYFYECIENEGAYSWQRIDVQPNIIESVNGQTGIVTLTAEDVGALSEDTVIPTKTSELTNDSNFVDEDDLATKQDIIQYETLPTASETLVGKIVQYIGNTTLNYHNGYFYQCVEDEVEEGQPQTYSWIAKSVQQGGGSGTSDYEELQNLPKINNVTLVGNKSLSDLSIYSKEEVNDLLEDKQDSLPTVINGKFLHTNETTGDFEWIDVDFSTKLFDSSLTEAQILTFITQNVGKEISGFFFNSDINAYCSFSGLYMSKTTSGTEVHYGYCTIRGIHETEYLIDYRIDWEDSEDWYKVEIVTSNDLIDYQPKLPEVVKDRYLHTNSTTGNLEWSEVGGDVPVQSDWGQTDSTKLDFIKNKPTKLSDFTNDEGFVDNTVNNLTNYYLKTEIYTKTQTDDLLDDKVDIISGKGLSTNDYTNTDKDIVNSVTSNLASKVNISQGTSNVGKILEVNSSGNLELTQYIDDTTTLTTSVWSSNKVNSELDDKINEPSSEGTNGQVLTTDGNGGRSWTTVQSGSGTAWGQITGSIGNQTDLSNVLTDKLSLSETVEQTINSPVVIQDNSSTYLEIVNTVEGGTIFINTGKQNPDIKLQSDEDNYTIYNKSGIEYTVDGVSLSLNLEDIATKDELLTLGTSSTTAYRGDYGNTAYTHATDNNKVITASNEGLYKIGVTSQGHISSVASVLKSDITALGIPAQDTTYSVATTTENGLMSSTDKGIVNRLSNIPTPPNTNGNYFLKLNVNDGVATYSWADMSQLSTQWTEA